MAEQSHAPDPDDVSRILMLAFGKMEDGVNMFWCYVAVKPSRYDEFRRTMAGKYYNLQNYVTDGFGEIVVSGPGGLPPKEVTALVGKQFGIPLKDLFADVDPMQKISKGIEVLKSKLVNKQ